MNKIFTLIIILLVGLNLESATLDTNYFKDKYSSLVEKIIHKLDGDSSAWNRLAYMCDTYGHRLSGSKSLNQSLYWAYDEMKKEGFENVNLEPVMVPHWVRNDESAALISPRYQKMNLLALGGSVGTTKEGITAPVVVFKSFDELDKNKQIAKGKIVLFNMPYLNYGQAVQFRTLGAQKTALAGGLACLIRPVSPMSMNNPHTGVMYYVDSIPKVPAASITEEDAELLERMYKRGQNPKVHLVMGCETLEDTLSYNLMGEIRGTEKPEEIIAIGGHIDCWDASSGAHDDGGGVIANFEVLSLMKKLNIKPKRTIRCVFWVNEENGLRGGRDYADKHKTEKHVLMFEMDGGVFPPSSMNYDVKDSLFSIIKNIEPVLKKIESGLEVRKGGGGVDISPMVKLGVPGGSIGTRDEGKYFWYHHSATDTPEKVKSTDMNKCVAALLAGIYIFADLP
jgi:carboxypeptidase Q